MTTSVSEWPGCGPNPKAAAAASEKDPSTWRRMCCAIPLPCLTEPVRTVAGRWEAPRTATFPGIDGGTDSRADVAGCGADTALTGRPEPGYPSGVSQPV